MEQQVLAWISHYGYPAIFCLLMLGIVGLPVPDETLLTFTGYMIFAGHFKVAPAYATVLAGTTCGITVSYTLGRTFGLALIHRFGKYVHLTEERLGKAHRFFERIGHWSLTFGYFVPGVRHLTAYAAGVSYTAPHVFALYAYLGALLWSGTFVLLGYYLGDRWQVVSARIHHNLVLAAVLLCGLVVLYLIWRRWNARRP
ncbi:MAG TPA: DedA family protein [Bryobacteraceae bacterium]|nr:DedA family protein [Bryobacteraceae bacterium]